ncbi:MAG: alpha/beta hydrolase-fold protein [Planctomycetota bacterium]|nr:alpha/beta hydrolase-fold protein [Planctomycetota bacterium]
MKDRIPILVVCALCLGLADSTFADEKAIVRAIERFFLVDDYDSKKSMVAEIERDEDYDPSRLNEWLHRASLFAHHEPGVMMLDIVIDHGQSREVLVRVPELYDPSESWPMLYALHGSGSSHRAILQYVLNTFGHRIDEYIIVAPNEYRQTAMGEEGPPSIEHEAILQTLRTTFHLDNDRVFVTGYSKGGYTTWTLATLMPDRFAGAIPIACSYSVLPYAEGLWETMLPNLKHVSILHCWGEDDQLPTLSLEGQEQGATITQQNNFRLRPMTRIMGLTNITHFQQTGTGHGGVIPRQADLEDLFRHTRTIAPHSILQKFRYVHQAQAYWLEGHRWRGKSWSPQSMPIQLRPDEDFGMALGREVQSRLGELQGEIEGQTIRISQRHVGEMTLWIGDDMIEWDEPVKVMRNKSIVFEGHLERNLLVCLLQAQRTFDFDRLRWVGLRIRNSGKARFVTGKTHISTRGVK